MSVDARDPAGAKSLRDLSAPELAADGLLALQMRMTAYLLQPDAEDPTMVPDVGAVAPGSESALAAASGAAVGPESGPDSGPAVARLGIYHRAYRARLLETLRDTHGHTARLLGSDAFDALALAYIAQSPSSHRNLRWYGQTWPEFLVAGAGAAEPHPHPHPHAPIAELARLDWALREAFDGPDDTVLHVRDLQHLAPEAWGSVRLRPHTTVRCLSLRHNTLQRWHALDEERPVPEAVLLPEPGWLLVWRRDDRPHFRSMVATEAWAVQQLLEGCAWGALCDAWAVAWPDQDVTLAAAQCLRRWLDEGVLAQALPS